MPHPFHRLRALACLTAAALLLPTRLLAAAGDLDSTFGGTGTITTPVGGIEATGIAVQKDGKIILAGTASGLTGTVFLVARYLPDGSPDASFNSTGATKADFSTAGAVQPGFGGGSNTGRALLLLPSGKILVAGDSFNGIDRDMALLRFKADGTLDATFRGSGGFRTGFGADNDFAQAMALQADGRIIVAGRAERSEAAGGGGNDFALARFLPDGDPDPAFGGTGRVITQASAGSNGAYAVAVQADGKIVAAGNSFAGGRYNFTLVRYLSNGTLDTGFNGTGIVVTTEASGFFSDEAARSLTILPGGSILAAGSSTSGFTLARYLHTGTLDSTFGTAGIVTTAIGTGSVARATVMALQRDGKIVVAGNAASGATGRMALARYLPGGQLDPGFGSAGTVFTVPGSASCVALQKDGYIVAAGANGGAILAARHIGHTPMPGAPVFLFDPTVQTAFVGGSVTFDALATSDPAPTYQWMHNGSPIDGATGLVLQLDEVTLDDAGSYSVVASNGGDSTPSASATLLVLQTGAPRIVQQPKDVKVKRGRASSLTVGATGTPPLSYQWYFEGGTPFLGETRPTLTFPAGGVGFGRYYVVVTNALGQTAQSRLAQIAAAGKALPAPKIKPESQSFSGTLTLEMTCAMRDARIHYTTDGSLPDASSPIYNPLSPPVLSQTSIVSAVAIDVGGDRAQSPVSAVRRYFKSSDSDVDLGTLAGNRLLQDDALGTALDTGIANDLDRYTFTTTQAQTLRVSVSENTKRGPLMLDVITPGGQPLGTASGHRGGAIQWESTGEQPAGTYTVRVRLPDGLLDAIDKLRHWPYRLTISGGPNWTMLAASGRDTTVHHVGLRALRPADSVVAGKAAWVVSHGRASSPSAENIDGLARTLAASEGDGTQVLLVDWETAADDNLPTGFRGADWIIPVGKFMAERLQALGITGAKLSLAGHSWGSYVIHEIGRQLTSTAAPPKRLVALDPAAVGGRAIKFSTAAQHSWSFFSSGFGSPVNAATAHDAFVLGVPRQMDDFAAHGATVSCFSGLLRQHLENAGDTLAARFALDQIEPGHWIADQVRATYPDLDTFPDYRILPVLRPAGAKAQLHPFEAGLFIDEEASVTRLLVPPGS